MRWSSSPSIPVILRFVVFLFSQNFWMFFFKNLFQFMFSLSDEIVSYSYLQPLRVSFSSFLFCSSTFYRGCLSLCDLFFPLFFMLSCCVFLGCSYSLCCRVPLFVLSAGTSSARCLDNSSHVCADPCCVALQSPLGPSVLYLILPFWFMTVFVTCGCPVDVSGYWSSLPVGNSSFFLEKLSQSGYSSMVLCQYGGPRKCVLFSFKFGYSPYGSKLISEFMVMVMVMVRFPKTP